MGIEVPDIPDDPDGPGLSCPIIGDAKIPSIQVSFTGINKVYGIPAWFNPNGIWHLPQIEACSWRKTTEVVPGFTLIIDVAAYGSLIQVGMTLSPVYGYVYVCSRNYLTCYGTNSYVGYFSGGNHQIIFSASGLFGSIADMSAALGISAKPKTFVEPMGVNSGGTAENLRFARQRDGTCVYVRRS